MIKKIGGEIPRITYPEVPKATVDAKGENLVAQSGVAVHISEDAFKAGRKKTEEEVEREEDEKKREEEEREVSESSEDAKSGTEHRGGGQTAAQKRMLEAYKK
jgi:hypothetical protein